MINHDLELRLEFQEERLVEADRDDCQARVLAPCLDPQGPSVALRLLGHNCPEVADADM